MAFWNDVVKNVGNFFNGFVGGNNNQQKKKRNDQGQSQSQFQNQNQDFAGSPSFGSQSPSQSQIKVQQPKRPFDAGINNNLRLPGTPSSASLLLKPTKPPVVKQVPGSQAEQEINAIAAKKLPAAEKNVSRGQDIIGNITDFFTGNNKRIATQAARNQAVGEYQDKHGFNKDPGVMKYIGNTRQMGQDTSRRIKTQNNTIDTVIRKSSEIPVLSDFTTIGSAGANLIYNAVGDKRTAQTAHDNYTKAVLGMSDSEISKLPKDQQDRLRNLQTGLTVASPAMGALDIASLGGAGVALGGLKTAAVAGGRGALIQSGKTALKTVGKNALIAGAAAPVVSAPIENYVNNGDATNFSGYDPSSIPRQSATAALWSVLLPGASKKPITEDINNARTTTMRDAVGAAAETARSADEASRIRVRQPRDISVSDGSPEGVNIPVTNNTPQGRPIIEVAGDTPGVNQVKVPTPNEVAAQRFVDQPVVRPDNRIEGVSPTNTGNTGVFTRAEITHEQNALDGALKSGELDPAAHKVVSDGLNKITAVDDAPKGQKIQVQDAKNIPVVDQTTVPTGLPEVPGTVRAIESTSPNNARSAEVARGTAENPYRNNEEPLQAVAEQGRKQSVGEAISGKRGIRTNADIVDVALPKETQKIPKVGTILPDGTKVTKVQVKVARLNAKNTKAKAKADESAAASRDRISQVTPDTDQEFAKTGDFNKGKNGNIVEGVNKQAEKAQAAGDIVQKSPAEVFQRARANQASDTGKFSSGDIRETSEMLDSGRIEAGTPEWHEANAILKEAGSEWGQTGALRKRSVKNTAGPNQIISQFQTKVYRLANDPTKIKTGEFDQVSKAAEDFTAARDSANAAHNRFTESPTSENTKAYYAADDAVSAAEKNLQRVEFKVAKKAIKGNKDIKQVRELEKMAQEGDLYQMDHVDAAMLSGTGTFSRNFANAGVGAIEEGLFGKGAAKLASQTKKSRENNIKVGGGFGRDSLSDFGKGVGNVVDASKARASAAGKNPLEHLKNWATTGNQVGDAFFDTQTTQNVKSHYTQVLKDQGYKGRELTDRAGVMARQDPNGVGKIYNETARIAAGIGSGITRENKLEILVKNLVSDNISGHNPNKYSEFTGKLVARMTVGFPTAIGKSGVEGVKRFTLGAPTFAKAIVTKDPQARAILMKEGIKQAGTGSLVIPPLFYALGASGVITGAYPDGKEERARWEREGISENSVKIGNDYYQLPAYLGAWAVPGLFYARLGSNGGDWSAAAKDTVKIVPDMLPTGGISSILDVVNGRKDLGKFMAQMPSSAVRASTPAGALLNQLAKSFDPTKNDTNSGTTLQNFIDKVVGGIPGASNTLKDKTDEQGNVLTNPNPFALLAGASSSSQQKGVEHTGKLNDATNGTIKEMDKFGAFADPNIRAVITDDKTKKIYADIVAGKQVSPDDVKKVQDAMIKGVSDTGTDTTYLEKEQYDSNLTALNLKRNHMAADPTTKPSDLAKMDTAIKRGHLYKDNTIPYELISAYESTSLSDWRAMGNPKNDNYDPEAYQKLWAIDELMAKSGVSYKRGDLNKQKYSGKSSGGGRGGGRGHGRGSGGGGGGGGSSRAFSSEFGQLKTGAGAPTVQQYDTLSSRSGAVPTIQVQRPNIVHKIGFSG